MSFVFEERGADAPLVQTIWRTDSERARVFTSVAVSRWEIVVTRRRGRTSVAVRGPETRATRAPVPGEARFFGIAFEHGAWMPALPPGDLVDGAVELPLAGTRSFWLDGRAWEIPTFDNADTFVARLARRGLLVFDRTVGDVLRGESRSRQSTRTLRRRTLEATGLTPTLIRRIDQARKATALLQRGLSIADVVAEAGYFDQSHLHRALVRFAGQTPAVIRRAGGFADMSLSYKTHEFARDYG